MKIAVIPGDGIGKEVIPVGQRVLEITAKKFGFNISWVDFDWGCEKYQQTQRMMPSDGLKQLADFDAIYLGAVGFPGVPDHTSLWGLLIPIRRHFQQYISLRPVRLFEGISSPLANRNSGDIDMVIVRENNEGEYSEIGGRIYAGTDMETVSQESIFTRKGVDRVMHYAFDLAGKRSSKVTSATKSNGIIHTMPFWDERFDEVASQYPGVSTDKYHIDILTANFVLHPDWFDVVVGSNLFGDILSDLGPAVAGTIGIAASGNINPEKQFPSMFEPVHGSAPDIAGKGIANPIGSIWAGSMMLEHLGHQKASDAIMKAIEVSIKNGSALTPDMGGKASTEECGNAVIEILKDL